MRESWIGPLLALAVGSMAGPLAACDDAPGPRAGDNAVYPANARGRIALLELPLQGEQMPSVSAFLFEAPEVPPEELVDDRDHTVTWDAGDDEASGFQLVLRTGWHGTEHDR